MPPAATLGVDVGATKIAAALVDAQGRVLEHLRTSTPEGGEAVLVRLAALLERLGAAPGADAVPVGIGVAGQVDPATGTVWYAPNLRWRDFPLGARLAEVLGRPVAVFNDVQAAALGEWLHGAGRGTTDLLAIFVGTGIGGGVVSGGRLLRGCSGSAGEIGHVTVDLDGPPCHCGGHGCLEALAGGWALAERARAGIRADPSGAAALLARVGGDEKRITAREVVAAAGLGDALAAEVLATMVRALGAGVASLVNAFNPCLVVLGGGVVEGFAELTERVAEAVRGRALPSARAHVRVVPARLGGHAGVIGAAAWVRPEGPGAPRAVGA